MNAYPVSVSVFQASLREDYMFYLFNSNERFKAAHAERVDISDRVRRMDQAIAWRERAEEIRLILFRWGDYAPLWN